MKKLIIGNWKMNTRRARVRELIGQLLALPECNQPGVGVSVPAAYLADARDGLQHGAIKLAAQDVSQFADDGAYTGEISASMLKDAGCAYVLIGHSERRQYFGEDNPLLLKKLLNVIAAEMVPVFCVGETLAQRESGIYLDVIKEQLSVLSNLPNAEVVVAYEPVWAIGTGKVASLEQIAEIHAEIRKWCLHNCTQSDNIRLLYGGSVKAENAKAILETENVDGALVGGASLDAASFGVICQAAGI